MDGTGDRGSNDTTSDVAPPAPSLPPAGWFPDPTMPNTQRYWDGTAWTEHLAPIAAAATPANPVPGRDLATFGQRVGAFLLDGLFILGVLLAISLVLVPITIAIVLATDQGGGPPEAVIAILAIVGVPLYLVLTILMPLWYRAKLTAGRHGATVGKAALGIEVIDRATGGRPSTGRAWGREAMSFLVSGQVLYLGYLWMLWDDEQRTWHDMVANTHVVLRTGEKPTIRDLFRDS